jgi:hypothetical protein
MDDCRDGNGIIRRMSKEQIISIKSRYIHGYLAAEAVMC